MVEIMKTLETENEKDWRVFRHGIPTDESIKFNEENADDEEDVADKDGDVRECAMNLDEFKVTTCVDCQKNIEEKDAWWYHGDAYCKECYHAYLDEDQGKEVDVYQVGTTSGGGCAGKSGCCGLGRDDTQRNHARSSLKGEGLVDYQASRHAGIDRALTGDER